MFAFSFHCVHLHKDFAAAPAHYLAAEGHCKIQNCTSFKGRVFFSSLVFQRLCCFEKWELGSFAFKCKPNGITPCFLAVSHPDLLPIHFRLCSEYTHDVDSSWNKKRRPPRNIFQVSPPLLNTNRAVFQRGYTPLKAGQIKKERDPQTS